MAFGSHSAARAEARAKAKAAAATDAAGSGKTPQEAALLLNVRPVPTQVWELKPSAVTSGKFVVTGGASAAAKLPQRRPLSAVERSPKDVAAAATADAGLPPRSRPLSATTQVMTASQTILSSVSNNAPARAWIRAIHSAPAASSGVSASEPAADGSLSDRSTSSSGSRGLHSGAHEVTPANDAGGRVVYQPTKIQLSVAGVPPRAASVVVNRPTSATRRQSLQPPASEAVLSPIQRSFSAAEMAPAEPPALSPVLNPAPDKPSFWARMPASPVPQPSALPKPSALAPAPLPPPRAKLVSRTAVVPPIVTTAFHALVAQAAPLSMATATVGEAEIAAGPLTTQSTTAEEGADPGLTSPLRLLAANVPATTLQPVVNVSMSESRRKIVLNFPASLALQSPMASMVCNDMHAAAADDSSDGELSDSDSEGDDATRSLEHSHSSTEQSQAVLAPGGVRVRRSSGSAPAPAVIKDSSKAILDEYRQFMENTRLANMQVAAERAAAEAAALQAAAKQAAKAAKASSKSKTHRRSKRRSRSSTRRAASAASTGASTTVLVSKSGTGTGTAATTATVGKSGARSHSRSK